MAYDYDKIKQQYEALSPEKQKQFAEMNKNDTSWNYQKFMNQYNAEKNHTTNTAKTTGTTVSKNTVSNSGYWSPTEYQPNPSWTNKSNSYVNQWQGNYAYDEWTKYYEKQGWNQTYSSNANVVNSVRDAWNAKSYEEQQELLKNNPKMQETLTKYGITNKQQNTTTWVKQSPYENQWEGQYYYDWEYYRKVGDKSWANKWDWDYQDNSPERTAEIIRNLDDLSKSNPWLFSDYDTFYNAFIAGKGRSPEQIKVLNDYFNKMKQYNKYDNMSSDELWYLLAHWEPAEDYLSYLKYNDPQRYAEIQESRKKNENQIMNETYLNTVASQAGYDMWDSNFWKWNQEEMWYRDVNKDWLDDRLYHAPTAEELKLVDENNQYEQERAKLTDAYKWLQEDLTNQYPDADLSTIMLLTSDRWNKIQRALDTLAVNQTKVQWSLKYLQNERATMDDAWQQTINEIQKQYGMYYDYSPQWMAERAQAQYAATNVTLDQADNGTDTQKQMALDSVLSDYYDKYWSIIQRSKSQVINDVMAYAKKNGVSLSQALEDNFLKPLRAKPWFAQLNSVQSSDPYVVKVWDVAYRYKPDTDTFELIWWWTPTADDWYSFTDYSPITTDSLENWLSKFMEEHQEWDTWWQCGSFVNDYLQSLWYDRLYTDPIDKKKAVTNTDTPTEWAIAVMDSKKYPEYWHVAIVTEIQWDKVKLLESNRWDDKKVHSRWVNKSDIYGYFNPSLSTPTQSSSKTLSEKFWKKWDWNPNWYFDSLARDLKWYIEDWKLKIPQKQYESLKQTYWIDDREFRQMATNYANSELKDSWWKQAADALEYAVKCYELLYWNEAWWLNSDWFSRNAMSWIPWLNVDKAKWEYDSMMKRLSLKELFDAKALWATFGAMSDSEWNLLENAATDVSWGRSNFKDNLEELIESLYDASVEWNAKLPKSWEWSKIKDIVMENKSKWSWIWWKWQEDDLLKDLY